MKNIIQFNQGQLQANIYHHVISGTVKMIFIEILNEELSDVENHETCLDTLLKKVTPDCDILILDFINIKYVTSGIISILIRHVKQNPQIKYKMINVCDKIHSIFTLLKLDLILNWTPAKKITYNSENIIDPKYDILVNDNEIKVIFKTDLFLELNFNFFLELELLIFLTENFNVVYFDIKESSIFTSGIISIFLGFYKKAVCANKVIRLINVSDSIKTTLALCKLNEIFGVIE